MSYYERLQLARAKLETDLNLRKGDFTYYAPFGVKSVAKNRLMREFWSYDTVPDWDAALGYTLEIASNSNWDFDLRTAKKMYESILSNTDVSFSKFQNPDAELTNKLIEYVMSRLVRIRVAEQHLFTRNKFSLRTDFAPDDVLPAVYWGDAADVLFLDTEQRYLFHELYNLMKLDALPATYTEADVANYASFGVRLANLVTALWYTVTLTDWLYESSIAENYRARSADVDRLRNLTQTALDNFNGATTVKQFAEITANMPTEDKKLLLDLVYDQGLTTDFSQEQLDVLARFPEFNGAPIFINGTRSPEFRAFFQRYSKSPEFRREFYGASTENFKSMLDYVKKIGDTVGPPAITLSIFLGAGLFCLPGTRIIGGAMLIGGFATSASGAIYSIDPITGERVAPRGTIENIQLGGQMIGRWTGVLNSPTGPTSTPPEVEAETSRIVQTARTTVTSAVSSAASDVAGAVSSAASTYKNELFSALAVALLVAGAVSALKPTLTLSVKRKRSDDD